jgi:hypothetical protein
MEKSGKNFIRSSDVDILQQLDLLDKLSSDAKHNYSYLVSKRKPDNLQHQILLILLARVCKYLDAYLLLTKNGYGEPSINLLRSIIESSLWMRWIVIKEENAIRYCNSSKGESIKIAQKSIGRGLAKIKNVPDPSLIKKMLKDEIKKNTLPNWEKLAQDTGMMDYYVLFYKFISATTHGNLLAFGEALIDKNISPDPDYRNIEPYISLANNMLRDCLLVAQLWIEEGKIREVPDLQKLLGL